MVFIDYILILIVTYHILLSSITIVLYIKEIFENWTRVVNKNQSTKSSKQMKTAGDSTDAWFFF